MDVHMQSLEVVVVLFNPLCPRDGMQTHRFLFELYADERIRFETKPKLTSSKKQWETMNMGAEISSGLGNTTIIWFRKGSFFGSK